MAPEQAEFGTADRRTDLYALGCILFEMLTGEPLFAATMPVSLMHSHISEQPRLVSDLRVGVPSDLTGLISSLLEKQTQRRPPDARTVYNRLRPHLPMPGQHPPGPALRPDPTLPFREPCVPQPAMVEASRPAKTTPRRHRRTPPPPSRDALRSAREKAAELGERGFLLDAVRLLTEVLEPALKHYGPRDRLIVELRVARADLLLEAGDRTAAREAYTDVKSDAVYVCGDNDQLIDHIDSGLDDSQSS
jgi:serine/threonine protein kinase